MISYISIKGISWHIRFCRWIIGEADEGTSNCHFKCWRVCCSSSVLDDETNEISIIVMEYVTILLSTQPYWPILGSMLDIQDFISQICSQFGKFGKILGKAIAKSKSFWSWNIFTLLHTFGRWWVSSFSEIKVFSLATKRR